MKRKQPALPREFVELQAQLIARAVIAPTRIGLEWDDLVFDECPDARAQRIQTVGNGKIHNVVRLSKGTESHAFQSPFVKSAAGCAPRATFDHRTRAAAAAASLVTL